MVGRWVTNVVFCLLHFKKGWQQLEHLDWVKESANFKWKNPRVLDTAENTEKSLFESNIKGDWDTLKGRFLTFTLRDHEQIKKFVKDF